MDLTSRNRPPDPLAAAPPKLVYDDRGKNRFNLFNRLGFLTLVQKETRRFLKVYFQTVISPVISTLLFLVVFQQAFGAMRAPVHAVPYVEFLAPGLIMMAILTNAFANSSSSIVIGKVQGSFVDVLMAPLSPLEVTAGLVAGAAARGLLVGIVTLAASALYLLISGDSMGLEAPLAVLYFGFSGTLMFAMIGVIGGVWADKFDQLAAVNNFLITPLTFLSGTFYAISNLPEPFLSFSRFNPVFYLIDGFRYGFIGEHEAPLMTGVLLTLTINVALAVVCYHLLRSGWKLKS